MNAAKTRVYISGALTGVENPAVIKAFYEAIGLLCEEIGFLAYVPHINTDPINHPNISPRHVFETDKHQVTTSDLIIAYLGFPAFGVGMELAYAESKGIPIILLYEKHKVVSRFPRGIPTVLSEIEFSDYQDALTQLENVLKQWRRQ
ncbi:XRE family transcriptional regulator [Hassallia byssoidea VB512170]|uniref:XRE family transcriptional regulator n=1 Tax=Hassallia byssoidea VB512170 TaxID=1304833 RepID=A0A846H7L1_9CYAN|nr:XRE family transcriptional regulator [Hassalia byssoidea]NEU72624.1 XRE family transcriptional regulator [Hassalia byssoidea VB512170]